VTVDYKGFIQGYLAEVEEHLSAATKNLVAVDSALRAGQREPRAVRELFRSMHTVKGLSAMIDVAPIVDVTHAMETLLRTADRAGGALDAAALDALSDGLRAVEQRVTAVAAGKPVAAAPAALIERLERLHGAGPTGAAAGGGELVLPPDVASKLSPAEREQLAQGVSAGKRAWRLDFVPTPSRAATGLNITSVRERVGRLAEIVKVYPVSLPKSESAPGGLSFALVVLGGDDATPLIEAAAAATAEPLSGATAGGPPVVSEDDVEGALGGGGNGGPRRVRVDVARLDDAMEKLSALVVNRFRLQRAVAALRESGVDVRQLGDILNENARQLRDLRAAIMRARMVPMEELLERIPLLVRGLERTTGKQVRVHVDAGRAELDKAVAERLLPAIVHLVRNAVDHAIEPPADRVRGGKDPVGRIDVTCHERTNNRLELSVRDDGRGIDRQRVADKAQRPLPSTNQGLLDLLTLPGLSTRDAVSTTSGRGYGMDIVKRVAVDALGGELKLDTEPGQGTTFTLLVPLTITIVDAFSFVAGGQPFVTPVSSVDEILEVDPARLVRGPALQKRGAEVGLYQRRGEGVPLVALDQLFALAAANAGHAPGKAMPRKAMVVRRHGQPFAFAVERMLGQQEVVVRPLEDPLVRVVGVSGSTDLGDGRPTLVLDLVALSSVLSTGAAA
jgi:two-component system chemotaxis sensor kinase CheA